MVQPSPLSLSPPDRCLDRDLLEAAGGFLWWYADLVDDMGNGMVLIWSFGLPFLPGYASAARSGRPQMPSRRPSLNVALYRRGELDFYLLQEYAPDQASWSDCGDIWRFGQSELQITVEAGRLRLRADLDCAVGGSNERLVGRVDIDGVCRKPSGCESSAHEPLHHDWTPRIGPARGHVALSHGDRRWDLDGRAYHDRNGGGVPLHSLGIDHWLWGRVPQDGRELIYYLVWPDNAASPECMGLSIEDDGTTEVLDDLNVTLRDEQKTLGGLTWWETLELSHRNQNWLTVRNTDVVDSGPFYMRYLTEAGASRGVGELVKPQRIDLAHHRPLVRMRVHDTSGPNSMWLPLFTGPKKGRVRRLVESWVADSWIGGGRQ